MSRNREPVNPLESESESGEESDDGSSEEDASKDSEPQQTQTSMQKKSTTSAPQPPPSSEEEESGSETESESDEPDSIVKPIEEAQKSSDGAKKSSSKPITPVPATPTKPVAAKRPATEDMSTPKDAKKKKADDPETFEKKSNLFQRLFTEEDEIVLLKGLIDYKNKKKTDPIADLNAFHEFIKKKLHTDFTRAQVQDKIRRLKNKFKNNRGKGKEGKERTFSKPHEQKAYDLSMELWGNETSKENGVVGSPKASGSVARKILYKKVNETESEVKNVKNAVVVAGDGGKSKKLNSSSGGDSVEHSMLITGSDFYEAGLGTEGENEWDKLRVEELKLYLKQLEVRAAQTKLVLDIVKREDH